MTPINTVKEISIVYSGPSAEEVSTINSSFDAYEYLLKGFNPDTIGCQEQFVVAYLNQGNRPLGLYKASQGGITGTVADIRLILSIALKTAAVALIIAHNHPSGQLKPSRADEELTRKIMEAAKVMDLKLLDHLIVAPCSNYYSFADTGTL